MKNPIFRLPTIDFVGGSTETLQWNLWHLGPNEVENKDQPFNANGCTVTFSLVGFTEKSGRPDICRKCTLRANETGEICIASITLSAEETQGLEGKFLYQLTIKDTVNDIEISQQGIMYIWRNLNKALFGNETITYLKRD